MKETFKKGGWQIPVNQVAYPGAAPPFFGSLIPQENQYRCGHTEMNLLSLRNWPRQITAGISSSEI